MSPSDAEFCADSNKPKCEKEEQCIPKELDGVVHSGILARVA